MRCTIGRHCSARCSFSIGEWKGISGISTRITEKKNTTYVICFDREMHSVQPIQFEDCEQLRSAFASYEAKTAQKLAEENVIGTYLGS